MKKRVRKPRKVASLLVKSPGRMLSKERKDVAAWLRKIARNLERCGDRYTDGRFTAGFSYI